MKKTILKFVHSALEKVENVLKEKENNDMEKIMKLLDEQMMTLAGTPQMEWIDELPGVPDTHIGIFNLEGDTDVPDFEEMIFVECEHCGNMIALSINEDKGIIECTECNNEIFVENDEIEFNIYDTDDPEDDNPETVTYTTNPFNTNNFFFNKFINHNN